MTNRLFRAVEKRNAAENNHIERVLHDDYPPGKVIAWSRNGRHVGKVVSNGYFDRIKVRNASTGKEYWIHAADIVL